jgi:hypothetical protein
MKPFGLEFLEDQTIVYSKSPYGGGTSVTTSICSSSCPVDGGEDSSTDGGSSDVSDINPVQN